MKYEIDLKEIVVVEGKDDTARLKNIAGIKTIETHGYGINKTTWKEIEKAYDEVGIIIFTDPDHAGEQIRKRIKDRFPFAKEAFLPRDKAKKKKDIGIENASEEDIIDALEKAKALWASKSKEKKEKNKSISRIEPLTQADIWELGLVGENDSKSKRVLIADEFGFGYGNGKQILEKINLYKVSKAEIRDRLEEGMKNNDR